MKASDLAKWCEAHPDVDIYIANFNLHDDGQDVTYHEIDLEQWESRDPNSHWIAYPGDLISG